MRLLFNNELYLLELRKKISEGGGGGVSVFMFFEFYLEFRNSFFNSGDIPKTTFLAGV